MVSEDTVDVHHLQDLDISSPENVLKQSAPVYPLSTARNYKVSAVSQPAIRQGMFQKHWQQFDGEYTDDMTSRFSRFATAGDLMGTWRNIDRSGSFPRVKG